jgi:hypothetical protein
VLSTPLHVAQVKRRMLLISFVVLSYQYPLFI